MSTSPAMPATTSALRVRRIPVSRASILLTDRSAFDAAVKLSVDWMGTTARSLMPAGADQGDEFEFSSTRASVSAASLGDSIGRVWSGRITNFADAANGREWTTDLFVQQTTGSLVRFGAQLTCLSSALDTGFEHSRPRVVREVLDRLAGEEDGQPIENSFSVVGREDVDDFYNLLVDPQRRLPIVVVSTDYDGSALVDMDQIANRLSGTAHLRCLSINPSFALTDRVGKRLSIYNGAVRVYMPGLDLIQADPFLHPLWIPNRTLSPRRLLNEIAHRVLPLGFRDADGDTRFWQINLLRQVRSRAIANAGTGSDQEQLQAENNALELELKVQRDEAESAKALMEEAGVQLDRVQGTLAQQQEENDVLRRRFRSERATLDDGDIAALFKGEPSLRTSLKAIASAFSDRIVVLDSAYTSADQSQTFRQKAKAFEMLWAFATQYWSALAGGEGDGTARQCFGTKGYAAKESSKLSQEGRKRRTFTWNDGECLMEKHLKIGVADNKADTLRVHFEWFAPSRTLVIGHCGGHLDF